MRDSTNVCVFLFRCRHNQSNNRILRAAAIQFHLVSHRWKCTSSPDPGSSPVPRVPPHRIVIKI